jgi:hypothetical protein
MQHIETEILLLQLIVEKIQDSIKTKKMYSWEETLSSMIPLPFTNEHYPVYIMLMVVLK